MIPRKIYLQYVGDSDEKPTDNDNIRDADVTWSRERVFKHDLVYTRRAASNPTRQDSTTVKTSHQQQGKVWDEKAEHENDLRWESRQDFETWTTDNE